MDPKRVSRQSPRGWWAANRARIILLAIAGLALGGIVCMLVIVLALIARGQ